MVSYLFINTQTLQIEIYMTIAICKRMSWDNRMMWPSGRSFLCWKSVEKLIFAEERRIFKNFPQILKFFNEFLLRDFQEYSKIFEKFLEFFAILEDFQEEFSKNIPRFSRIFQNFQELSKNIPRFPRIFRDFFAILEDFNSWKSKFLKFQKSIIFI